MTSLPHLLNQDGHRRPPHAVSRAGNVYRVLASSVVGVLVLAVVGAVLGPQWDPAPLTQPLQVQSTSTAITGAPTLHTYPVRTEIVTVQLDGASVQAQITEPVGAPGPRPGVVFIHGAGTGKFAVAFRSQAAALASAGVVAMVPDKRLDTYSTAHRDYVAMAADYDRSVQLLRAHPGVDPARVGVYAESEGGWIAPVIAATDRQLAFVILVSSPVVPPRQQAAFASDQYLRNTGVPHGVFRAIPRAVGMTLPGGFEYVDFDVQPYQQKMTQPVLVVYGTGDASMPVVQGAQQILADTARAGNDAVTVRYYAGADHGIKVDGTVSSTFLQDMTGWVLGLPATASGVPQVAGAQPVQLYLAGPVPQPSQLRDGNVVLLVVLGAAGLVLLGCLLVVGHRLGEAWTRRRSARDRPAGARWPSGYARYLVAFGGGAILTVAGLVWYLLSVARLAMDYQHNSLLVQGGWLALRLAGMLVVVAGVLAVRRARAGRVPGSGPGAVRTAASWTVATGGLVLLVVLAYWGVYQLGV